MTALKTIQSQSQIRRFDESDCHELSPLTLQLLTDESSSNCCFFQPAVQNPTTPHLLSWMTRKAANSLQLFDIIAWKWHRRCIDYQNGCDKSSSNRWIGELLQLSTFIRLNKAIKLRKLTVISSLVIWAWFKATTSSPSWHSCTFSFSRDSRSYRYQFMLFVHISNSHVLATFRQRYTVRL